MSGGQKQRSSIARALFKKGNCLILDDALSAVDTSTEREILDQLKQLKSHACMVLISHRVSTLQSAQVILVLDYGKLVEFGSPSELDQQKGLYYQFLEQQSAGRVLEL